MNRLLTGLAAAVSIVFAAPAAAAPMQKVEGDRFTVSMPGEATREEGEFATPQGKVMVSAYSVVTEDAAYSLTVTDYPDAAVKSRSAADFLTEDREGIAARLKGTVKSRDFMTLGTNPGQQFLVSSDNGEVKSRSFMVGNRVYSLLVLYNPHIGAPQADDFLSSLQLKK